MPRSINILGNLSFAKASRYLAGTKIPNNIIFYPKSLTNKNPIKAFYRLSII